MLTRIVTLVRRHPMRTLAIASAGVVVVLLGGGRLLSEARWLLFTRQLHALENVTPSGPAVRRAWTFVFRGHSLTLTATIDPRELELARALDGRWVFGYRGSTRERFVRRLVRSQADGPLVADLAEQTRALRRELGLGDDGYLELLASAVQDIPYDTADKRLELPAEVLADGRTVCSGKTVLLGALMLHEGYDCVVWAVDSTSHTAMGVATNGPGFAGSDYAFIETTRRAFIGEVDPDNMARGALIHPPQMISLGGRKRYDSGRKTYFVLSVLRTARSRASWLEKYQHMTVTSSPWREQYSAMAREYAHYASTAEFIEANRDDLPRTYENLATKHVLTVPKRSAPVLIEARALAPAAPAHSLSP